METMNSRLYFSGLLMAAMFLFSAAGGANPVSAEKDFELNLSEDGQSVTATYLAAYRDDHGDGDIHTLVEVKTDDGWKELTRDWHWGDDVIMSNGGSGEMEYYRVSTSAACPDAGEYQFRISVLFDSDGEVVDLEEATIECAAAGEIEETGDDEGTCSFSQGRNSSGAFSLLHIMLGLFLDVIGI